MAKRKNARDWPVSLYRVECMSGPDKGIVRQVSGRTSLDATDACGFQHEPGMPYGPLCIVTVIRTDGDKLAALTGT